MPGERTVYSWLAKHEEFQQNYARAQAHRAEFRAEEIVHIADTATAEDVQVAKLRVDTRKWVMAREAPKKYGDRIVNEHTGGEKPVEISTRALARDILSLLSGSTEEKES